MDILEWQEWRDERIKYLKSKGFKIEYNWKSQGRTFINSSIQSKLAIDTKLIRKILKRGVTI